MRPAVAESLALSIGNLPRGAILMSSSGNETSATEISHDDSDGGDLAVR